MITAFTGVVLGIVLAAFVFMLLRRKGGGRELRSNSILLAVQDVGELVAVTAICQTVGEWRDRQDWKAFFVGDGRAILILEMEAHYKFDLRASTFSKSSDGDTITLPPCRVKYYVKSMRMHSEEESKVLPYIPGIRDILPGINMPVEKKNEIIEAARRNGEDMLRRQDAAFVSRAQKSAEQTLASLFTGLGVKGVQVRHSPIEALIREEEKPPAT